MIERALLGLDRIMTQQAVIERDQSTKDAYGAKTARDWETLSTVACFMWWGTGTVITRQGSKHFRPEETADLEMGGMVLPEGTDVTAEDRISAVLDGSGNTVAAGPLTILSVGPFEGVTELMFRKAS